MQHHIIICQKKIAGPYKETMQEFIKRLSRYGKTEILTIKRPDQAGKYRKQTGIHYRITPGFDSMSSENFARKLQELEIHGQSHVYYYIGCGEAEESEEFHLSSFEMDPGLSAALLTEQIYRAYRIIKGEPYHK